MTEDNDLTKMPTQEEHIVKCFPERKAKRRHTKKSVDEGLADTVAAFIKCCYRAIVNITGPELYLLFCEYLKKNHLRQYTKSEFLGEMTKYTGKSRPKRIMRKHMLVYNLLDEHAIETYDEMLKKAVEQFVKGKSDAIINLRQHEIYKLFCSSSSVKCPFMPFLFELEHYTGHPTIVDGFPVFNLLPEYSNQE